MTLGHFWISRLVRALDSRPLFTHLDDMIDGDHVHVSDSHCQETGLIFGRTLSYGTCEPISGTDPCGELFKSTRYRESLRSLFTNFIMSSVCMTPIA